MRFAWWHSSKVHGCCAFGCDAHVSRPAMPWAPSRTLSDVPAHTLRYVYRALRKRGDEGLHLREPHTEALSAMSAEEFRLQMIYDLAYGNTHYSMFIHASTDFHKCRSAAQERMALYSGVFVRIDVCGFQPVIDLSTQQGRWEWLREAPHDTDATTYALCTARMYTTKDAEVLLCAMPSPDRVTVLDPYSGRPTQGPGNTLSALGRAAFLTRHMGVNVRDAATRLEEEFRRSSRGGVLATSPLRPLDVHDEWARRSSDGGAGPTVGELLQEDEDPVTEADLMELRRFIYGPSDDDLVTSESDLHDELIRIICGPSDEDSVTSDASAWSDWAQVERTTALCQNLLKRLAVDNTPQAVTLRFALRWHLVANGPAPAFCSAFSQARAELFELLRRVGHDGICPLDAWRDENGWTLLHHAVLMSKSTPDAYAVVIEILPLLSAETISAATIRARPTGWTSLHIAACGPGFRRPGILRRLLQARADARMNAPGGYSALLLAARSGQLENCRVLMESGCFTLEDRTACGLGVLELSHGVSMDVSRFFVEYSRWPAAQKLPMDAVARPLGCDTASDFKEGSTTGRRRIRGKAIGYDICDMYNQ